MRDLMRSAIIHKEIEAGVLPSETELMLSFSTSRQVIRDALHLLRAEGLVQRIPGNGTFVSASKVDHPVDHLHGPATSRRVSHRILDVTTDVAAPRVADRLGLAAGDRCAIVDYVAAIDDEPYYVCTAYVPVPLTAIVEQAPLVDEWYSVYERAGIQMGISDIHIEATLADEFAASHLGVETGAPILLFERLLRDQNGNPLEYAFNRVRGDRITLQIKQPRRRRRPEPEGKA
ncbi:GntR family transcriptional regulator [Nocardioides humi]|uniref:GntR family transcriptional regulator n=1 Tax=Nocardioides humi TaxID=449461 RepID=A0ABN2A021_9ACTN